LYIIDLLELVATSRNYTELLTAWKGWRDATGKKMKEKYANFVRLSNEGVQQLGKSKLYYKFGLWCLTPLSTIFQLYRGG
jgi:peptidyl-dipeptidase A